MRFFFSSIFFFLYACLNAQSLVTGNTMMEEYIRIEQLRGTILNEHILSLRPVEINNDSLIFDPLITSYNKKNVFVELFPVEWRNQYNTTGPYGWNDGAMVPNKGYQTMLSLGIFAKYKGFSIQLKPEYVFAENKPYQLFFYNELIFGKPYFIGFQNNADFPERLGTKSYSKIFWGQSNVSYTYQKVSLKVSNENIWWGPSFRNSLILTNNAPGFAHIGLQSIKPITTPIGSFAFQLFGGELKSSRIDRNKLYGTDGVFKVFGENSRYFSGLYFSYHPKWVEGLTIGGTRTFQMYFHQINKLGTTFDKKVNLYFPVFTRFLKSSLKFDEDSMFRDQKLSVFFRYIMPQVNFEFYTEYGREDHSYSFPRFYTAPEQSRSYILGLSKLFPLGERKNFLFQYEMTNIENNNSKSINPQLMWYVHYQIKEGYSNKGQTLGAGAGTGGSCQTLKLSWNNSFNSLYIMFERFVHNNDLYYAMYNPNGGFDNRWVDTGLTFGWNNQISKKIYILANTTFINNYHYQWYESKGRFNVSFDLTLRYKL